eukprot:6363378-Alexandrium_andersonii.AAC.1
MTEAAVGVRPSRSATQDAQPQPSRPSEPSPPDAGLPLPPSTPAMPAAGRNELRRAIARRGH